MQIKSKQEEEEEEANLGHSVTRLQSLPPTSTASENSLALLPSPTCLQYLLNSEQNRSSFTSIRIICHAD
jgi:hypothetical protein